MIPFNLFHWRRIIFATHIQIQCQTLFLSFNQINFPLILISFDFRFFALFLYFILIKFFWANILNFRNLFFNGSIEFLEMHFDILEMNLVIDAFNRLLEFLCLILNLVLELLGLSIPVALPQGKDWLNLLFYRRVLILETIHFLLVNIER